MGKVGPSQGAGDGPRTETITVPAGDYLVALCYFRHKHGKASGKPFLSCKWEVIAGPFRGKGFWAQMNQDLTNQYACKLWEGFFTSCGLTEALEIEGNEGVINIARNCKGVPVKAAVKNQPFNGKPSNDLRFFHYPSKITDTERGLMTAWKDGSGTSNDYNPNPPAEESYGEPTPNDTGSDYGTDPNAGDDADDIPF